MSPRLPQLDTAPGYRRVASLIEAEILSGRLQSGDLLPIEAELAAQIGVNRSTLREGLRALEDAGLIRRARAKRLMVTIPDREAVAWANMRAMGLRGVSFNHLWQIQMQIEPLCARLAAQGGGPALAGALADNLRRTEAGLDDDATVIACDTAFHRLLAEAADNPALSLITEPIGQLLLPATHDLYRLVPVARHRLLAAHRAIAAAITGGDGDGAADWMTRHIEDFRRGYRIAGLDMAAPIRLDPQPTGA